MRRQTAGELIPGDVVTYPGIYLSGEVDEYHDTAPERVVSVTPATCGVHVVARVFFGLMDGRVRPFVEEQTYCVLSDRPVLVWS